MSGEEYNHQEIESKWQERWESDQLYRSLIDPTKPKFYALLRRSREMTRVCLPELTQLA